MLVQASAGEGVHAAVLGGPEAQPGAGGACGGVRDAEGAPACTLERCKCSQALLGVSTFQALVLWGAIACGELGMMPRQWLEA